jgi:rubredoxin
MTKQAYTDPKPVGSEIAGWDVYKGPMPGKNPLQNSDDPHMGPKRCSVCKGSGYDIKDRGTCRECGGTGFMTPTTTPEPPAVARHNYPSTQTTVPFMGKKKEAAKPSVNTEQSRAAKAPDWWQPKEYEHKQETPLVLRGARCPNGNCDAPNTHLVTAANGNGWWSCPNCGPLADIDRHPNIDPYNPPSGFKPKARSFKAASKTTSTGRIASIVAAVIENNPGLTPQETLGLARQTARRYPEAQ